MGRMNAHPPMQEKCKDGLWQSQFLDTVGDGTGSIEMGDAAPAGDGVDYVGYSLTVPPGKSYFITRMIGAMEVAGKFASAGFGTNGALVYGCQLWRCGNPADPNDFDYQWTYQHPIQKNNDWGHYAFDVNVKEWSNSYQTLLWRYTITKDAAGGTHWLKEGQSLCLRVYDDISLAVDEMHIRVAFVNVDNKYVNQ